MRLILCEEEMFDNEDFEDFEDESLNYMWLEFPSVEVDGNVIRASGLPSWASKPKSEWPEFAWTERLGGELCRIFDERPRMSVRILQRRVDEPGEWLKFRSPADQSQPMVSFSGLDCEENRAFWHCVPVVESEVPQVEVVLENEPWSLDEVLPAESIKPLTPLLGMWIRDWKEMKQDIIAILTD